MKEAQIRSYQIHFFILQVLLLTSYMFHQTESWNSRALAVFSVIGTGLLFFLPRFKNIFFLFLSFPILWDYVSKFPNLANHSNVSFFIFVLILPFTLSFAKKNPDEKSYNQFLYTVRWLVVITYFFAAFHKLNRDFFNPDISCANDKMLDYIDLLPAFLAPFKVMLIPFLPLLGFLTEAIIPLGLFIPAMRRWGLIFQVGLHFLLAPLGFTDFSSLAMSFGWCFVDPQKVDIDSALRRTKDIVIFSLILVIGLGTQRWTEQTEEYYFFEGLAFACIYLPFIWKVLIPSLSKDPLRLPQSIIYKIVIVLFFLYGFSNYLGLRTAGTFSMFSNLRTEGSTSNHFLLGSNPFKLFSFQEDAVEIVEVDERIAGFYRKSPKPGQMIPRIEFDRILNLAINERWKDLKMKVIYQGKIMETVDLNNDENFRFPVPFWQSKLMKFRAIDKGRPQDCKW